MRLWLWPGKVELGNRDEEIVIVQEEGEEEDAEEIGLDESRWILIWWKAE